MSRPPWSGTVVYPSVGMAALHVGPALPNAGKTQRREDRDDFARFEDRQTGHACARVNRR